MLPESNLDGFLCFVCAKFSISSHQWQQGRELEAPGCVRQEFMSMAAPCLKTHQLRVTALHYSPKAAQKSVYMSYTLFTLSIVFCSTMSVVLRAKTGPCCNQVKKNRFQVCMHQSFATDTMAPTTNFLELKLRP